MEQTYDEKKVARIAELESLLHEFESQNVHVPEVDKNTPVVVSNGPYDQITSGLKIIDFLRDLYQQKEHCLEDLKEAKAMAQETFNKTVGGSESATELKKEEDESNKENVPALQGRYLSLIDNPASTNYAIRRDTLNRLQLEIEELRKSNLSQIPEITFINCQKEIEALKAKNQSLQKRLDRTLQNLINVVQDQRDQIQSVLGYKISFRSDGIIRIDPPFVVEGDFYFLQKSGDNTENNESLFRICGANKDFYLHELGDIYDAYIIEERNTLGFLHAAALHLAAQYRSNVREEAKREEEGRLEQEVEGYIRENEQEDDMIEISEERFDQGMNENHEEVVGDHAIVVFSEAEDSPENYVNGEITGNDMDAEVEEEYEEDEEEEYEEEEFDDDINEYEETQAFDDDEDDYNDDNGDDTNEQNVIELDDDDEDDEN
ncbi:hypothetical protein BD770DRAFT_232076 [Pilaira anomala]|nr:hypothetical protein BD770DRAFT_232076 [Pilaira anomala]